MERSELPVHWRFAAGQAFAGLRELVYSFDFTHLTNGHTYVGVEPGYLVDVIDGFLSEPESVVFCGDRTDLQELQRLLVEQIQPAYQQGRSAARRCWRDGDPAYGSLSTEELHRLALESAPADEMLRGWFAEGFCYTPTPLGRWNRCDPRPAANQPSR